MTKESLLDNHSDGYVRILAERTKSFIYAAMDDWAKIECLKFMKWQADNEWVFGFQTNEGAYYCQNDDKDNISINVEQLYSLYKSITT